VDYIGWVDVLVARVSVLVFVLILLVSPVVFPRSFSGVALNGLLRVDALEDTAFLYRVVGVGMKLAWPFQGFVVIFLIISSTSETLDCVHLVIVVTRSFVPEIVAGGRGACPTLFGGHDCRCTEGFGCRNVRGCRRVEEAAHFVEFLGRLL